MKPTYCAVLSGIVCCVGCDPPSVRVQPNPVVANGTMSVSAVGYPPLA